MRVGVVGVGRIGQYHARVIAAHPDVTAVLITDPDAAQAAKIASEIGGEVVSNIATLLERVDAVLIASPTDTHAALIHQAIDARRPAFCEKPIALDLAATSAVARHARDAGVIVQVGFQRRFDAGFRAARDLVASGKAGRIYAIRIAAHDPAPPHEAYVPASGGIFRDLHIHDFDIVRWVLGQEVAEVYAKGTVLVSPMFERYGDVDTVAAILTFTSGTLGVLTGSRHDPLGYDIRLELFGSGDSVAVGLNRRTPLRSLEPDAPAPELPYDHFLRRFDPAYRAELNAWIDVAQGRASNPTPVEESAAAIRIALACDRSRIEGRAVRIDEISEGITA
jgi:myo-inositol 2-dehydrogenase/D-chiro-inositol 1-dehydrogenase